MILNKTIAPLQLAILRDAAKGKELQIDIYGDFTFFGIQKWGDRTLSFKGDFHECLSYLESLDNT